MKSLKPQNVAVENTKKRNSEEADTQDAQRFQPAALLPNTPQRILSANVLKLQRMIGNKAVQRLLAPRTTNKPMVQREPKSVGGNEYFDIGTNTEGILTLTITNPDFVNANITDIAVLDSDSSKITIKSDHTQIDNNGNSVTITINLNRTKMKKADKTSTVSVMFKIGSGDSSETEGEQQEDTTNNTKDYSSNKEIPPLKTKEDFTDEEAYKEYLETYKSEIIPEILRIGDENVADNTWETLPRNFKVQRLKQLEAFQLVDLLTITQESPDYRTAENFVANPPVAE